MKFLILTAMTVLTLSAMAKAPQAAKPAAQCYGNEMVSAGEPFLLTLMKINDFQLNLILEEMITDGFLTATDTINFQPSATLVLSVNTDMIATFDGNLTAEQVNESVSLYIKGLMKKYKISKSKYALECNGMVFANPRAGGMN